MACSRPMQEKSNAEPRDVFRMMPVTDQGRTEMCWAEAYLTCIATERLRHYGDSIPLSPLWLMRASALEQSREAYLTRGSVGISFRATGMEAERLMREYGMVPRANYDVQDVSSRAFGHELTQKMRIAANHRVGLERAEELAAESLPRLPHGLENGFYLFSVHYTPQEFAHSLLFDIHMQWLTSYLHHPLHEPFAIELPDNRRRNEVVNVPLNEFLQRTVASLAADHPVYWEGRMSDDLHFGAPLDNARNILTGNALQRATAGITASLSHSGLAGKRQTAFERFDVTDQHAMVIIGAVKDKSGKVLLACQNSYGKRWGDHGVCYMPLQDFLVNTVLVGVIE